MLDRRAESRRARSPHEPAPSTLGIVVMLGCVAAALIGGYLLVMSMIGESRREDCAMSGRRNCDPIDYPAKR